MPGTIEDTAEEVTREGGRGIPVRCDHANAADVERLFARVQRDEGRLDLLVNNAWGGHEAFTGVFDAPFWEQPLDQWEAMMDRGVRNHLLASRAAVPSMLQRRAGLVVTTTFWDDLAKAAMNRLALGMAEELRPHGIASVAVSPGWMRTELILTGHRTDEAHWRDRPALALAADPRVMERTGQVLRRRGSREGVRLHRRGRSAGGGVRARRELTPPRGTFLRPASPSRAPASQAAPPGSGRHGAASGPSR